MFQSDNEMAERVLGVDNLFYIFIPVKGRKDGKNILTSYVKDFTVEEVVNKSIQVIGFTRNADFQLPVLNTDKELLQENIILLRVGCQHEEFLKACYNRFGLRI